MNESPIGLDCLVHAVLLTDALFGQVEVGTLIHIILNTPIVLVWIIAFLSSGKLDFSGTVEDFIDVIVKNFFVIQVVMFLE